MIVVLTGPESCGKTWLAARLAKHFQAPLIEEYARAYLSSFPAQQSTYTSDDLLTIAKGQRQAERSVPAQPLMFADTDLQVIRVWWQERFGSLPGELIDLSRAEKSSAHGPRRYLLCHPDLPWQADPLRENPADRPRLLKAYQEDMAVNELAHADVVGQGEARLELALDMVERWLRAEALPGR